MLKNWKSLFVKSEEGETETQPTSQPTSTAPSFPINQNIGTNSGSQPAMPVYNAALSEEAVEVMQVYEKGLDSINMPGYDFFEFYQSVQSAGFHNEQAYTMAYQMAKTLDKTVTLDKLVNDADFYISKINEVHSQYVSQGQQKINQINDQRAAEKNDLTKAIDQTTIRINQLRTELGQLENELNVKRETLSKIDQVYLPQEQQIRSKLNANDLAKSNSISKLETVRTNLKSFIKSN